MLCYTTAVEYQTRATLLISNIELSSVKIYHNLSRWNFSIFFSILCDFIMIPYYNPDPYFDP